MLNSHFAGTVSLANEEEDTITLKVRVENHCKDFAGTVRILFGSSVRNDSYDTELVLPANADSTFLLTVSAKHYYAPGKMIFLDKSENELEEISFNKIKPSGTRYLGVLSDFPDKLSYLCGDEVKSSFRDKNSREISLKQLQAGNLKTGLGFCEFLIVDSFDTSTLEEDDITAVESWVKNGGCLLLGKGTDGQEAAAVFDFSEDSGLPPYWKDTQTFDGKVCSYGRGAVLEVPFSLCGEWKPEDIAFSYSDFYYELLNMSVRNRDEFGDDFSWQEMCAFRNIDMANAHLPVRGYAVFFCIYMMLSVFGLYLVLKKLKRQAFYRAGVLLLALLFTCGGCYYGQSLPIRNGTMVYSVTTQRADGSDGEINTIYQAYDKGKRAWLMTLSGRYDYGEADVCYMMGANQYPGSSSREWQYHTRVAYKNDRVHLGMKPATLLEPVGFHAKGKQKGCGKLLAENLTVNGLVQSGTVINLTETDFSYMMLLSDECMLVFQDIKKGEELDLAGAVRSKRLVWKETGAGEYLTLLVNAWNEQLMEQTDHETTAQKSALIVGVSEIREQFQMGRGQVLICGLSPEHEKTVVSRCSEYPYRCLYRIVEQEENHASN